MFLINIQDIEWGKNEINRAFNQGVSGNWKNERVHKVGSKTYKNIYLGGYKIKAMNKKPN